MAQWNKKFRPLLGKLRCGGAGQEFRIPVLLYGIMAANVRGRFWHDQETIAADLSTAKPRVTEAIKWLREREAITIVPPDKRIGAEQRTSGHVYELTGYILLEADEGEMSRFQYLHLDPPHGPEDGTLNVPSPADGTLNAEDGTLNAGLPLYEGNHEGGVPHIDLYKNALVEHGMNTHIKDPNLRYHWYYLGPIAAWLQGTDKPASNKNGAQTVPGCPSPPAVAELIEFLDEWRSKPTRDGKPLTLPNSVGVFAARFSEWQMERRGNDDTIAIRRPDPLEDDE